MEVLKGYGLALCYELRMMHSPAKLGLVLIALGLLILLVKAYPDCQEIEKHQRELSKLQQYKPALMQASQPVQSAEEHFYSLLPKHLEVNEKIAQILEAAKEQGLAIDKAEYSKSVTTQHLQKYLVRLPVSGEYTQIRIFINQILNTQPYLALSEISLKREDISSTQISSQILFTLYVK